MSNQLAVQTPQANAMQAFVFDNAQSFEAAQRMATALSKSDLVPKEYKNNMPNCLISLEVAQRIGASPLMVMQNLVVIYNRPSWSSQFIISAVNSCGRFRPLTFHVVKDEKEKDFEYEVFESEWVNREKVTKVVKKKNKITNQTCIAWTTERNFEIPKSAYLLVERDHISLYEACKKIGLPILESPPVSIETACLEGWYDKSGSKWKTMPDLMLRYRSAAFFGRLYAPEILMGMSTSEEVQDAGMIDVTPKEEREESSILNNIKKQAEEVINSKPVNMVDNETGEIKEPVFIELQYDGEKPRWAGFAADFTSAIEQAETLDDLEELKTNHLVPLGGYAQHNATGAKDLQKAVDKRIAEINAARG